MTLYVGFGQSPMAAFLITWNSDPSNWDSRDKDLRKIKKGPVRDFHWFSGVTKRISIGDRIFLLKQGREPRGIIGAGRASSHSTSASRRTTSTEVYCTMEHMRDHEIEQVLDVRTLRSLGLASTLINTQAGGVMIPQEVAARIEGAWAQLIGRGRKRPLVVEDDLAALEGQEYRRNINVRKRVRWLRARKLEIVRNKHGRLVCEVPRCGFDFKAQYGAQGERSAVVHHVDMVSTYDKPRKTTLKQLAVVCANCHAMIHIGGGNRPLDSLIPRANSGTR